MRILPARKTITFSLLLLGVLFVVPTNTRAQEVRTNAPALATTAVAVADHAVDDRYRIGAGDVLDIRVFDRPQLSREAVRVDGRGTIRMPLIEGELQTACQTEGELAQEIATRYLKYQRNPQVEVFVKEYNSTPVSVMGAVNKPGQFQLQRRVRLLELLSLVGGTTDRAGERILVTRSSAISACGPQPDDTAPQLVAYNLNDTITGAESANPYLRPGDIVTVQEAAQAYVVGNVFRPLNISLKEKISVSRAIAMAGGLLPDSKSDRVRIVRQVAGSDTKTEIYVDLKAIDKQRADDVTLLANDIVDVPTASGKRILRTLLSTIAPAAAQFPLRIIR